MKLLLCTLSILVFINAVLMGCSSPNIHANKEVVANGGDRPAWVADTNKQLPKNLAKFLGHETDPLQYAYAISQANVDNEQLLPACYEFARANAANEFARAIAEQVQSSTSTSSDGKSSNSYAELIASTKSKVVGVQVFSKHWELVQAIDETKKTSSKITCWVLTGIPSKTFEALKTAAAQAITDKESAAQRVKNAVQSKQSE